MRPPIWITCRQLSDWTSATGDFGMKVLWNLTVIWIWCLPIAGALGVEPVPDRLVVLTFDDSVKSHCTHVRPVLLKYGFGATFFITEGWDFATNKQDYMSWDEI